MTIEQRLERVETSMRRWRMISCAMLLGIASIILIGAASNPATATFDTLVVNKQIVVGGVESSTQITGNMVLLTGAHLVDKKLVIDSICNMTAGHDKAEIEVCKPAPKVIESQKDYEAVWDDITRNGVRMAADTNDASLLVTKPNQPSVLLSCVTHGGANILVTDHEKKLITFKAP